MWLAFASGIEYPYNSSSPPRLWVGNGQGGSRRVRVRVRVRVRFRGDRIAEILLRCERRSPDHNVLVQAKNKQRSNAKDSKVEQASRAEFMASFQGDVGAHAFVDQFSSFLFPFFSLLTLVSC